jgi:hypothetical protein
LNKGAPFAFISSCDALSQKLLKSSAIFHPKNKSISMRFLPMTNMVYKKDSFNLYLDNKTQVRGMDR